MKWRKGIAFVRGINMFSNNKISQKQMLKLCKRIEGKNIKILKIVKTDNVIFEKKGIPYAWVGNLIERVLSIDKKIFVTTRSLETLKRCLK